MVIAITSMTSSHAGRLAVPVHAPHALDPEFRRLREEMARGFVESAAAQFDTYQVSLLFVGLIQRLNDV